MHQYYTVCIRSQRVPPLYLVGAEWGFYTFSLLVVQGFCRILPDFRGAEQPSLPLNVLMTKGFRLVQQALIIVLIFPRESL